MGVCDDHCPKGFDTVKKTQHEIPRNPPSVFSVHMNGLLPDLNSELIHTSNLSLNISDIINDMEFLCNQMKLNNHEKHGERYQPNAMTEAINSYLRSCNAYSAARDLLLLPHGKTIKRYF